MAVSRSARLRSALFDVLVSAGVVALSSLGIFMRQTPRETMFLGFTMAAALLVRRGHPLVAMSVVSSCALLQVLLFPPRYDPLPYDLAVLIGMYSVVKYARRMLGAWLAAATVGIGIVIEVSRHGRADDWWALAIWYVGVCGGVWLMAYTVRSRRAYVASLEERAATLERERDHLARIAVADERAAIARELHDVVAHSLSVMILQADGGRYAFDSDPAQARAALGTVAATGREALEDMRRLVGVLRGTSDPDGGADASAHDRRRVTLDRIAALVEGARTAGLDVAVETVGAKRELTPAIELTAYRIVQEALTNVLRHAARPAKARLCIEYRPDALALTIADDGGEPLVTVGGGEPAGNGLVGMRERVAVHDGSLQAGPAPDGGWTVRVLLPTRSQKA